MVEWTKPGGDAIDESLLTWFDKDNPNTDSSVSITHDENRIYYCYILTQIEVSSSGYRIEVEVTNSIESDSSTIDVLTGKY